MWSSIEGKDIPFEIIEGTPVVLRYYGEVKFGRFIRIDCVGHGRWKHTELYAKAADGMIFSAPVFWFSPVVTPQDVAVFESMEQG